MKVATIDPIRATTNEDIALVVQELQRQEQTRRDYVVPAKDISAVVVDDGVQFAFQTGKDTPPALFDPTWRAHETIWNRLDIQRNYYQKMGDQAPDLLAHNINYWAERSEKNFLVRTLDDKVRAFMSDRFKAMDSAELFFTTYKEVKEVGANIVQVDLTEENFYMKILHPEWAQKVEGFRTDVWARKTNRPGGSLYHVLDHLEEDGGQWLVPGSVIKNSDTGNGALSMELFAFDTICWNGLVHSRNIHQVHLGKQLEVGYLSQETRSLEDATLWSKVRDLIRVAFGSKDTFLALVKKMQAASEMELDNPVGAIDLVVKNFGFDETDRQDILNELMAAGSKTVYGLLTAVTAVGRDKGNQDEAIRFERAGGDILEDPREFVRVKRHTRTARQIAAQS